MEPLDRSYVPFVLDDVRSGSCYRLTFRLHWRLHVGDGLGMLLDETKSVLEKVLSWVSAAKERERKCPEL
jgi:hypothetical protein